MKRFWMSILTSLLLSLIFVATVYAADTQTNDFTVTAPSYTHFGRYSSRIEPTVTAGGVTLKKNTDYTLTYKNIDSVGTASVTVTGLGNWAGVTKTVSYQILRRDISEAEELINNASFVGMPIDQTVHVVIDGSSLIGGKDYLIYYENNCNVGTAYAHIVGIGNYCGRKTVPFSIKQSPTHLSLKGNYIGQADGTLDFNAFYYSEMIVTPGVLKVEVEATGIIRDHVVYYELYRIVGEEAVLVTAYETPYGHFDTTAFTYDLTSVYEDATDVGGEVYLLSYTKVDERLSVYYGMLAFAVPAKVPDATSMVVEKLPDIKDPTREYLTAYGPDGNVGIVSWSVSDPSIATVKDGVLTKLAPGTVTVTATYGNLTASLDVTVEAHDLRKAQILSYNPETSQPAIAYENMLLSAGTNYSHVVAEKEGIREVTATGKNNFYGYIMQQFDSVTGAPIGHTHTFREVCSETCTTCSFTRTCNHTKGTQWARDIAGHWLICPVCGGGKTDYTTHIPSAEDPEVCTVCGPLNIPGDLNEDVNLNDADALYLLRHTLFPTRYPVEKDADVNKDGEVNDADALYLLRHTLFPTRYPLYPG